MGRRHTPVLFIVFNRPSVTEKTFARIREYRPSRLYVAADGPRTNNVSDIKRCAETREIIAQIDWPCRVSTLFRDQNLGCAVAVSSAISWFFEHEEAGIILEDDCCPDMSFFDFCSDLLDRYHDHEQVMAICGAGFVPFDVCGPDDYFFSKYPLVWGWATWRRAWAKYSLQLEDDTQLAQIARRYDSTRAEQDFWLNIWKRERDHGPHTWDFQWYYWMWKVRGIAIHPRVNLIENIGFGPDATHTTSGKCPLSQSLELRLHPKLVRQNRSADRFLAKHNFLIPELSSWQATRVRLGRWRRKILCGLRRLVTFPFRYSTARSTHRQ